MKNPKAKESFATLAQRQNAIIRRPPTQEQVDRLNRIFKQIEEEHEKLDRLKSSQKDSDQSSKGNAEA